VPLVATAGAPVLPGRVGELELVGAFELRAGDPDFGGISAARLQGDRLLLLSDRSHLFELDWPNDRGARAAGNLPILAQRLLAGTGGRPLDAEAMASGTGGELLVGDEQTGEVHRFGRGRTEPTGKPLRLPAPFAQAGAANHGLETLARFPDGAVLAIAEGGVADDGLHAAALLDEAGAYPVSGYRAAEGFQPTDADVAGGWLFVLERRLSLIGGWQSRVAVLPAAEATLGAGLVGRELAAIAGQPLGENYEGIAARAEPDGWITLVLVSDDNFTGFQRTQLLELRWRR
jgi:hypothetical protein